LFGTAGTEIEVWGNNRLWMKRLGLLLCISAVSIFLPATADAAAECIESSDVGGTFLKVVCIASPENGAVVAGLTAVRGPSIR
jgi:hypothetical protein